MESPIAFISHNFDNLRLFDESHEIFSQENSENQLCKNLVSSLGSADSHTSTIYSSNHSPQKDYNIIYGSNTDNILEESFNQDRDDIYESKPKSHRTLEFLVQAEEEMQTIWKSQTKKAIVKPIIQNLQQTTNQQNSQNNAQSYPNKYENTINQQEMKQNAYWHQEEITSIQGIPERPSNPLPRGGESNYQYQNTPMYCFNQQPIQYQQLYQQSYQQYNTQFQNQIQMTCPQYYGQNYQTTQYSTQGELSMPYQYYEQEEEEIFYQHQQTQGFQLYYNYSSFQNEEAKNFYNYTQTAVDLFQ